MTVTDELRRLLDELGVEDPSRWATCECGEDVELFEGCHEAVCPSCGRVVMDDAQEG